MHSARKNYLFVLPNQILRLALKVKEEMFLSCCHPMQVPEDGNAPQNVQQSLHYPQFLWQRLY
jgi:hypothetical protein